MGPDASVFGSSRASSAAPLMAVAPVVGRPVVGVASVVGAASIAAPRAGAAGRPAHAAAERPSTEARTTESFMTRFLAGCR